MSENNQEFLPSLKAASFFSVSSCTLRRWGEAGLIDRHKLPSGQWTYDVMSKVPRQVQPKTTNSPMYVLYARVSSSKQQPDLKRQCAALRRLYPTHTVITDIASGINWNRRGLKTILELSYTGSLKEVVVSYRDRLCRFAFELIEHILTLHGTKLIVVHSHPNSDTSELAEDLLAISTVFACRQQGRRAAAYKKEKKDDESGQTNTQKTEDSGQQRNKKMSLTKDVFQPASAQDFNSMAWGS